MKFLYSLLLIFIISFSIYAGPIDLYEEGNSAYMQNDYKKAVYYYTEALKINPNYTEVHVKLAKLYYEIDNFDYAILSIRNAIKLQPNNKDIIIFTAEIETALGQFQKAENRLMQIVKGDPLNLHAYNALSNIYMQTGREMLGRKTLQDVLKADSTNFTALQSLGRYYENIDKAKAETYYQKNVEYNSLNSEGFFDYSLFLFKQKDFAKAMEYIKLALSIKESNKYYSYLGKYYLYISNGDKALDTFRIILDSGDFSSIDYYHIAVAYHMISNYSDSFFNFNRALRLRDDDEIADIFISSLLYNYFEISSEGRKNYSNKYYNIAMQAKNDSLFSIYHHYLTESIRLYPKNIKSRNEIASYYKRNRYPKRYFNELLVMSQYSDELQLKDKIEIEKNKNFYTVGSDWGIEQYEVQLDYFEIPLFVEENVENYHFGFNTVFGTLLEKLSYQRMKYEIHVFADEDYRNDRMMQIAEDLKSPFYLYLQSDEDSTSVSLKLTLNNSLNNMKIKELSTFQSGNNKVITSANTLLSLLDKEIPMKSTLLKIKGNRAVINGGRLSGIQLEDQIIILDRKHYPIELTRGRYLVDSSDIKAHGTVVKVDENISEVVFKERSFFSEVDVKDMVLFLKKE